MFSLSKVLDGYDKSGLAESLRDFENTTDEMESQNALESGHYDLDGCKNLVENRQKDWVDDVLEENKRTPDKSEQLEYLFHFDDFSGASDHRLVLNLQRLTDLMCYETGTIVTLEPNWGKRQFMLRKFSPDGFKLRLESDDLTDDLPPPPVELLEESIKGAVNQSDTQGHKPKKGKIIIPPKMSDKKPVTLLDIPTKPGSLLEVRSILQKRKILNRLVISHELNLWRWEEN
ncbi:phosphoprotein [Itacaiunas virus]|uniref:Phosphoprotein n=1 Tax=Itacaiunas virus TaxID=490111 RepID=A0A0D3R1F4_9RHAB|nr:phosphoprotein [Itacaiunas virus]AJR28285.1 phosphoprotein [Itacaiunas virus]